MPRGPIAVIGELILEIASSTQPLASRGNPPLCRRGLPKKKSCLGTSFFARRSLCFSRRSQKEGQKGVPHASTHVNDTDSRGALANVSCAE